MARMVADAGFNFNFGPVVDLRGGDPADPAAGGVARHRQTPSAPTQRPGTVVRYAETFIQAHHEAACSPHQALALPRTGHRRATHLGLVDVTQTAQPHRAVAVPVLIRSGSADAVMTAHLVNRSVDPTGGHARSVSSSRCCKRATVSTAWSSPTTRTYGAIQRQHVAPRSGGARHPGGQRLGVIEQSGAATGAGFQPRYDMGRHVASLVRGRRLPAASRPRPTSTPPGRLARLWRRLAVR